MSGNAEDADALDTVLVVLIALIVLVAIVVVVALIVLIVPVVVAIVALVALVALVAIVLYKRGDEDDDASKHAPPPRGRGGPRGDARRLRHPIVSSVEAMFTPDPHDGWFGGVCVCRSR